MRLLGAACVGAGVRCTYVTVSPVSSSGLVAPRTRILLLSAAGAIERRRDLFPRRRHDKNILIQTAAQQRRQALKIYDLCAKNSPLNYTHSLLFFFIFLPQSSLKILDFCLCKHASVPEKLAVQ